MQHHNIRPDEEEVPIWRSGQSALSLFVDTEDGYSGDELEEEDVRFAHPSPDLSVLTISGPLSPLALGRLLEVGHQLTRVQLSYGNLTLLPVEMCYALPNLTSLSLWNNKIASLPPQVALLTKLTELDLTRNCLSSLPSRIAELLELRSLQVEGNRLECFPVEIARMERLMSPQGRLLFTTNPLLSPSLVEQQRAQPKVMPALPTLMELSGGALLALRLRDRTPLGEDAKQEGHNDVDTRQVADPQGRVVTNHLRLPMDLERYLDEHTRCSVCGRFVWTAYVEELRYRVLRFRHMPVIYRCCSLSCLSHINES